MQTLLDGGVALGRLELDQSQARHLSGLRSTRETVDAALREFVARRQQQETLTLIGQDLIDPAYDVRAVRAAMQG